MKPPVLFLAWQDPVSRRWFPIGRLERKSAGAYVFGYIRGFEAARRAGLEPLPSFPDVRRLHRSTHLFPLFRNRVMNAAREEYADYLGRLGLEVEGDPDETALHVLARSRGLRSTDSFEIFASPVEDTEDGRRYRLEAFVHGLRHAPPGAQAAATALVPGDRLLPLADVQNPEDPLAIALRTEGRHLIGYVPRYHCADLHALFGERLPLEVEVLRVNPPPAAPRQRVLCRLSAPWPFVRAPLSQPEYDLLSEPATG